MGLLGLLSHCGKPVAWRLPKFLSSVPTLGPEPGTHSALGNGLHSGFIGPRSLGWEDPLEEGMATHSSILAWRIPGTGEPGGLQSMGSHRVGHLRDSTGERSPFFPLKKRPDSPGESRMQP